MARLLVCPSTSVWPSGADLATLSTPRLPLAPGRLSTSTLQPLCSAIFCATVRAVMSGPPPARNGTTSRIGRLRERAAGGQGRQRQPEPGGGAQAQRARKRQKQGRQHGRGSPWRTAHCAPSVPHDTRCAEGIAHHAVPQALQRGATVAKAVGQRAGIHRYQLTLAPESLTILPQRGTSVRSSSAKRSALPPSTSPPSERSFSATSGCASA